MSQTRVTVDEVDMDEDLKVYLNDQPFTGEVVEHGPDGVLVGLTTYSNGVEDGPSLAWWPDGTPRVHGEVLNGLAIGMHEKRHPNGTLAASDELDGQGHQLSRKRWDENGHLLEDKDYHP
ncbi:toxin-antitoxin system YwqK family antitoxin [Actinokineospora sp. G85]|uniref:toxin-antitoxin system YwqK family antitoxin n=1 Tax=Actinokineospora sp. G85 TaxID=3406626 RepID=UPI003C70D2A2